MKTKIVTAYWMDVEGIPFQGAYPIRKGRYLGSLIAHCQNLGLPVVCYTHKKSLEELEQVKKDFNLENLEIKILELDDIKYHKQVSEIRNSEIEKYSRELDGRGCEIMWGKFDVLEKELEDFEQVYWLDAGLQHPGIFTWRYSKKYNTIEDHHNPVHMKSWWAEYDVYNFPNFFNGKIFQNLNKICENKIVFITSYGPQISYPFGHLGITNQPFQSPYPVGAMIGGNVKILQKFIDNYWFYTEKILEKQTLCTEECIMKPAYDMIPKEEKIDFNFTSFSCCEHDDFHFKLWDSSWGQPKPFYMAFMDIIKYFE